MKWWLWVALTGVLILMVGGGWWWKIKLALPTNLNASEVTESESQDSSASSANSVFNQLQIANQNTIEENKRPAEYLYTVGGKVFYRWARIKVGAVSTDNAQFICMPDEVTTAAGEKMKVSQSWLDITSLYSRLQNGYRYPDGQLLSTDNIVAKVKKLTPMLIVLKQKEIPMLVIFFGCSI